MTHIQKCKKDIVNIFTMNRIQNCKKTIGEPIHDVSYTKNAKKTE